MTPLQLNRYKNKNSPLTHRVRGILFCLLPSSVCGRADRGRSARPQTGKRERRARKKRTEGGAKRETERLMPFRPKKTFFIRRGIFRQEKEKGRRVRFGSAAPFSFPKNNAPQIFLRKKQMPAKPPSDHPFPKDLPQRQSPKEPSSSSVSE